MKLLTQEQRKKLRSNADVNATRPERPVDHKPVVKLFNPCGAATWLFTELLDDGDTLFGLCDLGMGSPEIGCASLREIAALRLPFGLAIERDRWFEADKTLTGYADEARRLGRIAA